MRFPSGDASHVIRTVRRFVPLLLVPLVILGCSDAARDPFAVLAEAELADAAFARAERAGDLDAALSAVKTRIALLESARLPDELVGPVLWEGRRRLDRAEQARAAGDLGGAWQAVRDLADDLPAAEPRVLADALILDAEDRLLEMRTHPQLTRLDRERADRLLRAAREAAADADYPLAIRRAYYARQLLRAER
jgi:hypothetical protein